MAIKQQVSVVVLSEIKHLPLVILTLQVVSNRLLMTPIFFQTEPHSVHSARFAHPTRFNLGSLSVMTSANPFRATLLINNHNVLRINHIKNHMNFNFIPVHQITKHIFNNNLLLINRIPSTLNYPRRHLLNILNYKALQA